MLNRREWLTATTALAAWQRVQVSATPTRIPSPPAGAPDDEAFWSDVRGALELTSERINLVTVVRGITTKTTRESAAAESTRVNTFRADGGPPAEWRLDVRRKAAAFIGAPVESVALLRHTTEGVATLVNNWPLDRGDELLTSSAEHGLYLPKTRSGSPPGLTTEIWQGAFGSVEENHANHRDAVGTSGASRDEMTNKSGDSAGPYVRQRLVRRRAVRTGDEGRRPAGSSRRALAVRSHRARNGCVRVEREMRARSFVVRDVRVKYAAQARCTEDDDVVETFPPHGPNESFGVRVLPR